LKAQGILDPFKQLHRRRNLFRTVQFRFDDVDAASTAVRVFSIPFEIVQRGQRGDHGIEKSFGNFLAV
jgi:hypothetical protein